MTKSVRISVRCVCLLLAILSAWSRPALAQKSRTSSISLPPVFEQNQGQLPEDYRFAMRHGGAEMLLGRGGAEMYIPSGKSGFDEIQLRLDGANADVTLSGEDELPGQANYLRGSKPSIWVTHVALFSRVRYSKIYPGIDLVFHGSGDDLENDFTVAPGADVRSIEIRLNHAARLNADGDLEITAGTSVVTLRKPIAYQIAAGVRENVPVSFSIEEGGKIHFDVGAYDHGRPLIIDPVFGFSTYLTGTNMDQIYGVTTDAAGNVFVTGSTMSLDFPVAHALQATCDQCGGPGGYTDAFVSELDPTGHTLLFSTYLGGSLSDLGSSIAIDAHSNIIVAGLSGSNDFPQAGSVNSTQCQINGQCYFLSSLKPGGAGFNYSGLVGGSLGFFSFNGIGVLALDASGDAYLAGVTEDSNFPVTPGTLGSSFLGNGLNETFIMKLDPTGKLVYSTPVPGNAPENPVATYTNDFAPNAIYVDAQGDVTIAGQGGLGLPTTPGVMLGTLSTSENNPDPFAGFVLQINPTASAIKFATYVTGVDIVDAMTVDSSGDYILAGTTSQLNLPVSANAYQKTIPPGPECTCGAGFVLKMNSTGTTALGATYLASPTGSGTTELQKIALDSKGHILMGGTSGATDFPLVNPFSTVFETTGTDAEMILAEFSGDLSTLLFGSYLSSIETPFSGTSFAGMAVDAQDNLIVAGNTFAQEFPTTANSFQPVPPNASGTQEFQHGVIAKLDMGTPAPSVCLPSTFVQFGAVLVNTSGSQNLVVKNCGNAALTIQTITSSSPLVTPSQSCGAIAAGASCSITLTFTPVDTSTTNGTITLTDNAAIPTQVASFSGTGSEPQVFIPTAITADDELVGTSGVDSLFFENTGNGEWIVSSVTVTGDFAVDNMCTAPVPAFGGFCDINLTFTPSEAGVRRGTLTITDNQPGSPHVIAITGHGLASYPVPTITFIGATASDFQPVLFITGTKFFLASQVIVNGSPRVTTFEDEEDLSVQLTPADVAQPGELLVTVSNPLPGGGVSNVYVASIYGAMRNIYLQDSVFDPKSGNIYATVSSISPTYAGMVVAINPNTETVAQAWSIGNGPDHIAISDDSQFLYVGLDGDANVTQVSLPAGTVNFAASLGLDPSFQQPMIADAIRVLPGAPHSWAVTLCGQGFEPCGEGVAVFDDATERSTISSAPQLEPDSLIFVGSNAATLYGTTIHELPSTFYEFGINGSGVTLTQSVENFSGPSPGGGFLDTDGNSIYVSNGQVIDPATLAITSTFQNIPLSLGIKVDIPASRAYFMGPIQSGTPFYPDALEAFSLSNEQLVGTINLDEFTQAGQIHRFGTNGIAVVTTTGVLFFQTSLTGTPIASSQLSVSGWSPTAVPASAGDTPLTIIGANFASGDTVSANGTMVTSTVASATEIEATIPGAIIAAGSNVQIVVSNPADQTATFTLIVTAQTAPFAAVSPNAVTFASQFVGTQSQAHTVTVVNTGGSPLIVSSVTVTGDFSQTNNCGTVAASANCTIAVTFSPTTTGSRTGVLTINDNSVSPSQTVNLNGTGDGIEIGGSNGSGTSATVTSGQTATYNLSVVAEGFSGNVTFSCTNLPTAASCSINPPSAMLTGTAVPVTVSISTMQQNAMESPRLGVHRWRWQPGLKGTAYAAVCVLLFATLSLFVICARPKKSLFTQFARASALAILLALVTVGLASCGGGSSGTGGGGGGGGNTQTPAGTYTVNFVATSSAGASSVPLTLIVQ